MIFQKYRNRNTSLTSESESESDSDEQENCYSSSRGSNDRSSVTSIPWATDAIKQNQQIWEQIERIFFDEEELPTNDNELRREILEWKTAFPHIRIKGKKIDNKSSNENSTPVNSPKKSTNDYLKRNSFFTNNINTQSYTRIVSKDKKTTQFLVKEKSPDRNLSKSIGKILRISSVPKINTQKPILLKKDYENHNFKLKLEPLAKPGITFYGNKNHRNYEILSTNPRVLGIIPVTVNEKQKFRIVNKSASFVRMPPIFSIITPTSAAATTRTFYASNLKPTKIYISSSLNSSQDISKNPVYHLPAINSNQINIDRSISAALIKHRQISAATTYLPFSASKIKYSK